MDNCICVLESRHCLFQISSSLGSSRMLRFEIIWSYPGNFIYIFVTNYRRANRYFNWESGGERNTIFIYVNPIVLYQDNFDILIVFVYMCLLLKNFEDLVNFPKDGVSIIYKQTESIS